MKIFTKMTGVLTTFGLSLVASAGAVAGTVLPARQCRGCNPDQMLAMAKSTSGLGIAFIYDINAGVIRKYNRYLSAASTSSVRELVQETNSAAATTDQISEETIDLLATGTLKEADEMPADASVQQIFAHLINVSRARPNMVAGGETRIPIGSLGNDPGTRAPYDLRQAAWDFPNGTFYLFNNAMQNLFHDQNSLAIVDPVLAEFLFEFKVKSVNVSITLSDVGPMANGSVVWEVGNATPVYICDPEANCAKYSITTTSSSVTISFEGVYDIRGNRFPSPSTRQPNPRWRWDNGWGTWEGKFAGFLGKQGVPVDATGLGSGWCAAYILTCAWVQETGKLIGCTVNCE